MTFLVLAPPRSMTAWLSNLLTDGRTVCHHDVLANGGLARMRALAGPSVGFAESAGLAVPGALLSAFPGARIVVVQADPDRVAASLDRIGVAGAAFVRHAAPQIARAMAMLQGRALFVRDVDVLERAGEIAEYLTGHRPHIDRLALLRALRVTKTHPLRGDPADLQALIRSER